MSCPTCGDPFQTGPDLCERCIEPIQYEPAPSPDGYCAADGHRYYGDEWETTPESLAAAGDIAGRCYCGQRRYPAGGEVAR